MKYIVNPIINVLFTIVWIAGNAVAAIWHLDFKHGIEISELKKFYKQKL